MFIILVHVTYLILMHFFNNIFWEQLNTIVIPGTKFIFNLVTSVQMPNLTSVQMPNLTNINKWSESESFLSINDDITTYQFEWIHNKVKTEPFISEQILNKYLKRFDWKVLNKSTPALNNNTISLYNFYTWWIIEKY